MLPAMSAALVWAPPLIDWRSTSRPLSLKMPFSNAYHGIQSSALMLLYAATTLVQHGRTVGEGEPAAACVGEVVAVVGPAPPPQAVARIARVAVRTASVFVMSPPFRFGRCRREFSLDLRSPRLESVLDALQDRRKEHPGAGDEDHAGQHLRRLERLARDRDELADPVLRGDQLGNHDAGERVADAQPEACENEGHRAGQHHPTEDERIRGAERSRDTQESGLRIPDARHGVDDDREKRAEEDDRDLGLHFDAPPEDEQRDEDDARRAVEEVHERVQRELEARVPAHEQSDDQAEDDRHPVANAHLGAAGPNVEPDVVGLEELHERLRYIPWTGQEEDGINARVRDELPGRERDDDAERSEDERLVLLDPARLYDRALLPRRVGLAGGHRKDAVGFLDAHAAGTPAMRRSAGTASSSWIDSQIRSS